MREQAPGAGDLLDLSGIVAGKLTLALSSVELGSIVSTAVEAFRQEAEAGGVRLQADIADASLRRHGLVRAESAGPGRGAVFTVELPLAGDPRAPAA